MVPFELWKASFVFWILFSSIVLIPCVIITIVGRKMARELGYYPSRMPEIASRYFPVLIIVAIVTLGLFYILVRACSRSVPT